jgi:hypothetical protein
MTPVASLPFHLLFSLVESKMLIRNKFIIFDDSSLFSPICLMNDVCWWLAEEMVVNLFTHENSRIKLLRLWYNKRKTGFD